MQPSQQPTAEPVIANSPNVTTSSNEYKPNTMLSSDVIEQPTVQLPAQNTAAFAAQPQPSSQAVQNIFPVSPQKKNFFTLKKIVTTIAGLTAIMVGLLGLKSTLFDTASVVPPLAPDTFNGITYMAPTGWFEDKDVVNTATSETKTKRLLSNDGPKDLVNAMTSITLSQIVTKEALDSATSTEKQDLVDELKNQLPELMVELKKSATSEGCKNLSFTSPEELSSNNNNLFTYTFTGTCENANNLIKNVYGSLSLTPKFKFVALFGFTFKSQETKSDALLMKKFIESATETD